MKFQNDNALPVDGVVGDLTWTALDQARASIAVTRASASAPAG